MKLLDLIKPVVLLSDAMTALIVVMIIALILFALSFRLVTQAKKIVVERLGGMVLGFTSFFHFLIVSQRQFPSKNKFVTLILKL